MTGEPQARDDGGKNATSVGGAHPDSLYSEFAGGLLLGVTGALPVALPAAWRAASAQAPLLGCWLALWGATALVLAPTAGALRLLRPLPGALAALVLGSGLALGPLMVFAELLKRATHHRPLGATTFAIIGAGVMMAAVAAAARLWVLSRTPGRGRRWWRAVTGGLVALSLLLAIRFAVSLFGDSALRAGLLDGTLVVLLVMAAAALRRPVAVARIARVLGPSLWVVAVIAATITLRIAPGVHSGVQSAGPVLFVFSDWLAG